MNSNPATGRGWKTPGKPMSLVTFLGCLLLISLSMSASVNAVPDEGRISGKLVDAATGEVLIGVSVYLEGTEQGAISDIDGNYTIKRVAAGIHSLRAQLVGYSSVVLEDVVVTADKTAIANFQMSEEVRDLGKTIRVKGTKVNNTEAVLLKYRQKSNSLTDAVSAEQISRSGAGTAAEAVKTVVGASVVDGKYVYVRGLGDRYASTKLNGSALPTPDPDKPAFPMDLIPTSLLDNVVVEKSFTPDKPGDFAGGSVDMGTSDYPGKRTLKFSPSSSYNSVTTFEDDFLSHRQSSRNWLGYNGGLYDIPDIITDNPDLQKLMPKNRSWILVPEDSMDYYKPIVDFMDKSAKAFNPEFAPTERSVPFNQN